jgi:antitoxin PrlF
MNQYSKLTSKGQTTIPAEVRADLGIAPGDRIEFAKLPDGQTILRKAPHPLASLRGIIKTIRPYSTDEIVAMVRQMRDGTGWLDDRD